MKYLAVKDWKKHQHYKDDRPAWIKLYGALLDDAAFLSLPELAQLQLVKIWLLASRMGHPLPNDPKLLSGKIGCRGKFYLADLLGSGFLVYTDSRESIEESLEFSESQSVSVSCSTAVQVSSIQDTAPQPTDDAVFLEAWAAYPKRPGNSRADTWRQWVRRVKEGVDPLDMLEGTRRYAKFVEAEGTEPRYRKQSQTFYGQGRHFENDWTPSKPTSPLMSRVAEIVAEEDAAIERTAAMLKSRGVA